MDIEILRSICLSFPATTEDVKWGNNLCFCVGGKIYCIANLDPPHTFSFKVRDEEFDELSQVDGFKPAPYLAKAKWVLAAEDLKLKRNDLKTYLRNSYEMIKVKLSRAEKARLGIE